MPVGSATAPRAASVFSLATCLARARGGPPTQAACQPTPPLRASPTQLPGASAAANTSGDDASGEVARLKVWACASWHPALLFWSPAWRLPRRALTRDRCDGRRQTGEGGEDDRSATVGARGGCVGLSRVRTAGFVPSQGLPPLFPLFLPSTSRTQALLSKKRRCSSRAKDRLPTLDTARRRTPQTLPPTTARFPARLDAS